MHAASGTQGAQLGMSSCAFLCSASCNPGWSSSPCSFTGSLTVKQPQRPQPACGPDRPRCCHTTLIHTHTRTSTTTYPSCGAAEKVRLRCTGLHPPATAAHTHTLKYRQMRDLLTVNSFAFTHRTRWLAAAGGGAAVCAPDLSHNKHINQAGGRNWHNHCTTCAKQLLCCAR